MGASLNAQTVASTVTDLHTTTYSNSGQPLRIETCYGFTTQIFKPVHPIGILVVEAGVGDLDVSGGVEVSRAGVWLVPAAISWDELAGVIVLLVELYIVNFALVADVAEAW